MSMIVNAIFGGKVFRPQTPIDLKPNTLCRMTIEESATIDDQDAWSILESMIGTVEAPEDWSAEHDRYVCGSSQYPQTKL